MSIDFSGQYQFLKMRAISARRNRYYKRAIWLMVVAIIALYILFIVDLLDLNHVQDRIDCYSSSSFSDCSILCQDYHTYTFNQGLCCDYTGTDCFRLADCRSKKVEYYQGQYDHDLTIIIISSFANAILTVCCCWFSKRRTQLVAEEPLQQSISAPINLINNSEVNKKDERYYDSFVYVDSEITCAVCIEAFNQQKAILLKCGHIYHSQCIKDWSKKQQNCPICRSSQ